MTRASQALREQVYRANLALVESGLVMTTFGNVSGVDRRAGLFVIKPSGVPYADLTPDLMVSVSLESGDALEGVLRPSSDTPTHLEIYRAFPCGGIAHSHSEFATSFAQARVAIPCTGTTHADYFKGDIPVTRELTKAEVDGDYESNTGLAIVETFRGASCTPEDVQGVLVANHGPFTWGADAPQAVDHAEVMEFLARIAFRVMQLTSEATRPGSWLLERHHARKHGPGAYYGQPPVR